MTRTAVARRQSVARFGPTRGSSAPGNGRSWPRRTLSSLVILERSASPHPTFVAGRSDVCRQYEIEPGILNSYAGGCRSGCALHRSTGSTDSSTASERTHRPTRLPAFFACQMPIRLRRLTACFPHLANGCATDRSVRIVGSAVPGSVYGSCLDTTLCPK